ncbi:MAG: hypothetical protein AAF596_01930 [Planctomycetota bacterium]
MAPPEEKRREKQRRRRGRWIIVGVVLLMVGVPLGVWLYDLLGPNPPLIISKETTYITAPLDADGLPDYERYLLEQAREGVTPENNAAVLFWEALGLGTSTELAVEPGDDALIADAIGLELPTKCRPLDPIKGKKNKERLAAWLSDKLGEEVSPDDARVERTLDLAIAQPWRREEIPPLAEWVDENREALDLLVEASKRPKWFSPSPTWLNGQRDYLVESLLPHATALWPAVRALAVRAHMRGRRGESGVSPLDIRAIDGLADRVKHGNCIISMVVGFGCDHIGNRVKTFISGGGLDADITFGNDATRDQLARWEAPVASAIDQAERMFAIDAALGFFEDPSGFEQYVFDDPGDRMAMLARSRLIKNIALIRINYWFDRALSHERNNRSALRLQKDDGVLEEVAKLARDGRAVASNSLLSSHYRSERVGDIVACLMMPAIRSILRIDELRAQEKQLIRLSLVRHKEVQQKKTGDTGVASEAAIAPPVQGSTDIFSNKPLAYRKTPDGYLLYSLGANGVDDGGSNEGGAWGEAKHEGRPLDEEYWRNSETGEWEPSDESDEVARLREAIPAGADDISIRMPPPVQPWPWEVAE